MSMKLTMMNINDSRISVRRIIQKKMKIIVKVPQREGQRNEDLSLNARILEKLATKIMVLTSHTERIHIQVKIM